jgi:hypothetical protein
LPQGLREDVLSHQGEMLAALIRGYSFKIAELDQELTAIVPCTPLFTSLDVYLLNAKGAIALLRVSKQLDGRGDGVVMKKFEFHYQSLVNLGDSSEQVCLCKTGLSAETGCKFELEDDFLEKASPVLPLRK